MIRIYTVLATLALLTAVNAVDEAEYFQARQTHGRFSPETAAVLAALPATQDANEWNRESERGAVALGVLSRRRKSAQGRRRDR